MKTRFRLFKLGLALYVVVVYVLLFVAPTPNFKLHLGGKKVVTDASWGRVRPYDSMFQFFLGPASLRSEYELRFGRVMFDRAGVAVADDEHGRAAVLQGKPISNCAYQWAGAAVSVVVMIKKCIPPGIYTDTGVRPRMWIHVQSIRPKPSVVFLKYDPL